MREQEVRQRAFAMPLTSPAYPPGPYRLCGVLRIEPALKNAVSSE